MIVLHPSVAACLQAGTISRPNAIALSRLPIAFQPALLPTARRVDYATIAKIVDDATR